MAIKAAQNPATPTKPAEEPGKGYFSGIAVPTREALDRCIQCGMCLPHCPTYVELKVERASPRGRAALIRLAADGRMELNPSFSEQMNLCLDCRACETACPAGVRIGYLIESARSQVEQHMRRNPLIRLFRQFVFEWLFMRHERLEWAAWPLRVYQKSGLRSLVHRLRLNRLLPKTLRFMEELPPKDLKKPFRLRVPEVLPAHGPQHARAGYFLGCMMSLLFDKTTNATVEALRNGGCEVVTPRGVRCCGAPLMSEGFKHKAPDLMKFNIDLFEGLNVDYIVTDCAACGAALKEYAELFEDDPEYREKAERFSAKAREITEFLGNWEHFAGGEMPGPSCKCGGAEGGCNEPRKAVYDAPCHLCHARGVWDEPVRLARRAPGIELVPLKEADWCCGSAGLYNITHHDMAMRILERKMDHIESAGAKVVLTANPGCMLQLDYGARKRGLDVEVKHVVELFGTGQNRF